MSYETDEKTVTAVIIYTKPKQGYKHYQILKGKINTIVSI